MLIQGETARLRGRSMVATTPRAPRGRQQLATDGFPNLGIDQAAAYPRDDGIATIRKDALPGLSGFWRKQVSRSALGRNGCRFVSMTSRVRTGAETTPLLRKSAALGRKVRIRCGVLGTRRSQTLTDVPVAAWRSQAVWCGLPSSGLGVSAAADPPLPGELLASWDCRLACVPNFQSKAAFFRSNGGRNGKAGRP
jgi:hypothetical protein